jgi:ABC-type antimicrobial peptide transport system permease subunit
VLSVFSGGLAPLLAGVGLYGVTAYSVSRRRTELGIRMALGTSPSGAIRLVLRRVARQVAIGVVIGGLVSWRASIRPRCRARSSEGDRMDAPGRSKPGALTFPA